MLLTTGFAVAVLLFGMLVIVGHKKVQACLDRGFSPDELRRDRRQLIVMAVAILGVGAVVGYLVGRALR
jgi:hypothetical protein